MLGFVFNNLYLSTIVHCDVSVAIFQAQNHQFVTLSRRKSGVAFLMKPEFHLIQNSNPQINFTFYLNTGMYKR